MPDLNNNSNEFKNIMRQVFERGGISLFAQGLEKITNEKDMSIFTQSEREALVDMHKNPNVMKDEVISRYINYILKSFYEKKPKQTLMFEDSMPVGAIQNYSYLDRAIIMTYKQNEEKHRVDPEHFPNNGFQSVKRAVIGLLEHNLYNGFTLEKDTQGYSGQNYCASHIESLKKVIGNGWKKEVYKQMCYDVAINMASEYSIERAELRKSSEQSRQVQNIQEKDENNMPIEVKSFFPKTLNNIKNALERGIAKKLKHSEPENDNPSVNHENENRSDYSEQSNSPSSNIGIETGVIAPTKQRSEGKTYGMYYCQDIGRSRKNQEDALLIMNHPKIKDLRIALVSDGMGGMNNGEMASHIVIKEFQNWFQNLNINPNQVDTSALRNIITAKCSEISEKIKRATRANDSARGGGATLTGAIIGKKDALVLNVGDSRTYKVKDGKLEQITVDDSQSHDIYKYQFKQMYPGMTEDEMRFYIHNNVIHKYMGADGDGRNEPKFTHLDVKEFDQLVLCSDGVTDCMGYADIATEVKRNNPQDLAKALVNHATTTMSINPRKLQNNKGIYANAEYNSEFKDKINAGKDNTTAVVVDSKSNDYER